MTARVVAFEVQAGTSGRSIAQAVAAKLGYSYHEEDILARAASVAGVSNEAMAAVERVPSFFLRLGEVLDLGRAPDFQGDSLGTATSGSGWMTSGRNRACLERVIAELAQDGGCVIVGHAAPVILRSCCPGLVTVLIHGSVEARAARYAQNQDVDLTAARTHVLDSDREAATYLKRVYRVDGSSARLYDLSVSTDGVDDAVACDLVVASARSVWARREQQQISSDLGRATDRGGQASYV